MFPVSSFSTPMYLWHQQCPLRISSTATVALSEVYPTAHFHLPPFWFQSSCTLAETKKCEPHSVFKMCKKKEESICWHSDDFCFVLSSFPRNSVWYVLFQCYSALNWDFHSPLYCNPCTVSLQSITVYINLVLFYPMCILHLSSFNFIWQFIG